MWYFTSKKTTDQRPNLHAQVEQGLVDTERSAFVAAFPDAEVGEAFEDSHEYQFSFPHVIGETTNGDGSCDLLWSDGVRTPKPE